MERRLTAILSADVVGYSRFMELDEAGTLSVLKAHREGLIHQRSTNTMAALSSSWAMARWSSPQAWSMRL